MIIKKILLIVFGLLTSSFCFAENYCSQTNDLQTQLIAYQCPQSDEDLARILTALASDRNFVKAICSANLKDCNSGIYAFVEEAKGLATIARARQSSYCYMASEDQAQLLWYAGNYFLKVC